MSKLQILSTEAEARLLADLGSADRIAAYRDAQTCDFVGPADFLQTPIEVPESIPSLWMPNNANDPLATDPATDAANAEAMYLFLGKIRPVYASDRRVWSALSHTHFWNYSRWRYPKIPKTDPAQHIKQHWFVTGAGLASLRRNAVARLWWAAHLTVSPLDQDAELRTRFLKADRFHYTKVLLSSQQVYQDVMERDFGSNERLRFCFLDAFDQFRENVRSPDRLMKRAVTRLNLLLGYQHLMTVPLEIAHEACLKIVERAAHDIESSAPVSKSELSDDDEAPLES